MNFESNVDWLINWFLNSSSINKEDIKNKLNNNYFDEGWIDSFKFISFILDLEESFNIKFANNDFLDRNFSTINGLAKIIQNKLNENK